MRKCLNLAFPIKSTIKFDIHNYPDGHQHLKLKEDFNKQTCIDVICRINNANDMFILQQLKEILNANDMKIVNLEILYLFTARCDRKFSIGEALDLKIIAQQIKNLGAENIYILDLHSDKLRSYLTYTDMYALYLFTLLPGRLCFPDEGASNRLKKTNENDIPYYIDESCTKFPPILCKKIRNNSDIEIQTLPYSEEGIAEGITVIDDLCDGGGTFITIAAKLQKLQPAHLSLFVTHAIQLTGIEKVAKVYDQVFITNSYKDWEKEDLPINVTVIEVG